MNPLWFTVECFHTTFLLGKNELTADQRSQLFTLLRELAFSENMTLYHDRLNALYKSDVYKQNVRVQKYLQRNWLGCVTVRMKICICIFTSLN